MNLLKIAIVDDDIHVCAKIDDYCKRFFTSNRLCIDDYSNGLEYVTALQNGMVYDIIFMDIQMLPLNGIEAGRSLRQIDTEYNTYLIYISSYTDQLLPLFQNKPFDFIQKPVTYKQFELIASQITELIQKDSDTIFIQSNRNSQRIPLNQIIYAEIFEGRKSRIRLCNNNEYITYEKLSSLLKRLQQQSNAFIQIHKSYFVNINHIESFTRDAITLSNKTTLFISTHFKSETNKQLINHFLNSEVI